MKFSNEIPPIYEKILRYIPAVDWDGGVIICYGDTIHCKFDIPADKVAHESVHVKQQEKDKDAWWDRYLTDLEFRKSQELEAYKFEADFIRRTVKDRNLRFKLIHDIAKDFSSPLYGSIISFNEALSVV
jgi:hypothetical protein